MDRRTCSSILNAHVFSYGSHLKLLRMIMPTFFRSKLPLYLSWFAAVLLLATAAPAKDFVTFDGKPASGSAKRIVFLTGDEEYRSEEGLVQLAKILAERHGFHCTVLFAIDPKDGTINPDVNNSLPGAESLDTADAIVMMLRFRAYSDDTMKHFADAYLRGVPIVALRTSTHAFRYDGKSTSAYKDYSHNSREWAGGFGRQVLGETWVSHLGTNHKEATRAVAEANVKDHPLMRGVGEIFADSGAYTADPMKDSTILMRAYVLNGATPDAKPLEGKKNSPLQPVVWCREPTNAAGKVNRVLCTTMGAATDLRDESLRRLLVNAVYWGLGQEVPAKADVQLVGEYAPSDYSFKGYRKGIKPSDL